MKRFAVVLTIAILLVSTVVGVSAQSNPRLPSADVYVRSTDPNANFNGSNLSLYGSTTACTKTDWTYLQFDLSGINGTIGRALLTLHATFTTGTADATITFYQTSKYYKNSTTEWTEAGLTASNAPVEGTQIGQPIEAPTVAGPVTFGSATVASDLAGYLESQRSGGKASILVKLTGTCTQGSAVVFAAKENATATLRPTLEVFSSTAVELSKASAQAVSWPLYAGLGAVALFVVAGVLISRRRTA